MYQVRFLLYWSLEEICDLGGTWGPRTGRRRVHLRDMGKPGGIWRPVDKWEGGFWDILRQWDIRMSGGIWRLGIGGPESKCVFGNTDGASCIGKPGRSAGFCVLPHSALGFEDSVTGPGLNHL